jgi:hypothetical protein
MLRSTSVASVVRRATRVVATLGVIAIAAWPSPAGAGGGERHDRTCHQRHDHDRFFGLEPGEFVTHELGIPVRIVLVGFEEAATPTALLKLWLPASYQPVVRYPQFYGLNGRDLGLEYEFDHRVVRKGPRFTNRFFAHLRSIGQEGPRTIYQTAYNDQASNVVDVTPQVLYIDARSVERWLKENDDAPGDHYTIYFINWYGRDDFHFHVYTKTDEPDPDTGYNFGAARASRKIVAWGGSSSRAWFYDFSAGPEWNTSNWFVDDADLDGDGFEDYRMPPIWEYAVPGYRHPVFLAFDMSLLARFVAINLLFTTSPLYDPLVTAPEPFGRKIADITMLEDNPDASQKGIDFIDAAFTRGKFQSFQPYYRWHVGLRNRDPIDDGAKDALTTFTLTDLKPGCWQDYGTPFAQPFCYFDANLGSYVPPYRPRDYVAPVFAFNTTDAGLGAQFGLLGFADDNWVDGTQSYVFTFGAPGYRSLGYGFTSTTVHEVGHHIGLSHPHDGWDSEFGLDYGSAGDLYFAWAGDESDTVMHYISLSNGFGRHDRDNMRRWETAGYLNRANALAGDLLASPRARRARAALRVADEHAAKARRALEGWSYLDAATHARWAYSLLAEAAQELGVASARLALARMAVPDARVPKTGCRPRLATEELPAVP